MQSWFNNRLLAASLAALLLGQVAYLFGFTTLYVLALVWLIAVAFPYPKIFGSLLSRLAAASLIAVSFIQLASLPQFFLFPNSKFGTLSVLTTGTVLVSLWALRRYIPRSLPRFVTMVDLSALLVVAAVIVPLGLLWFAGNDANLIAHFAGYQSPDGTNHFLGIIEMFHEQHLDYRTIQYYPKGFHLSTTFMLHGFHAVQPELSWLANARIFVLMYAFWGALVGYLLTLLAVRLREDFAKKSMDVWAALTMGACLAPLISLLFLLPFVYFGFLNYYYIVAAIVCGVCFLYDFSATKSETYWFVAAYLLLVLGVSMSWGPLLAPALLLAPVLYCVSQSGYRSVKPYLTVQYAVVVALMIVQLIPLYLHFRYANLNQAQGINALGIIREFHFGLVLLGLLATAYVVLAKTQPGLRRFCLYFVMPLFFLVVCLVGLQYFTTGELRYYAIKTSFLLEMLTMVLGVVVVLEFCRRSSLSVLQQLAFAPVFLGCLAVFAFGLTTNPILPVRQLFRAQSHYNYVPSYDADVLQYVRLGKEGVLAGSNNASLHYIAADNKLVGSALLQSWANSMQYVADGTAVGGTCSGTIFSTLTYGVGTQDEQVVLDKALRTCMADARSKNRKFYIVTDKKSVAYLQQKYGTDGIEYRFDAD